MATIQLEQEVLAVESLIEEGDQEAAFRRLAALRERYGRRPAFRYLQTLFDAIFKARPDAELIREVNSLVAEQPDFTEAVSLLALLHHRSGDAARAEVFALEAIHSLNPRAQKRAALVLGDRAEAILQQQARRQTGRFDVAGVNKEAPSPDPGVRPKPVVVPTPPQPMNPDLRKRTTKPLLAAHREEDAGTSSLLGEPSSEPSTDPRPSAPEAHTTLKSMQSPVVVGVTPSSRREMDAEDESVAFISSNIVMPPPPTIPPELLVGEANVSKESVSKERSREVPTSPAIRAADVAKVRDDTLGKALTVPRMPGPAITPSGGPPVQSSSGDQRSDPPSSDSNVLSPELAVDRTGVGVPRIVHPSRPPAMGPSPEILRQWFNYARTNQVQAAEGGKQSTASTLLELAERVVVGNTPLSSEPIPLDRRGLLIVEQKLDAFRKSSKASHSMSERAAVTAAAAFLLGLLLKECDGKASDSVAEDGACKVILPGGATVRPLLVAAAFARARGPGLVETYDRAATAHMRRQPSRGETNRARAITSPAFDNISVQRRELDGGTLALCSGKVQLFPPPKVNFRTLATDFWASSAGQEITGTARRAGSFTLADIEAIEKHASRSFSSVGFGPPGTPWPWEPTQEQENLVVAWGAILGEVLISLYNGRWESDPGHPDDKYLFRVVLTGGVIAWPISQAYLRLARGIGHDLSVYVDAVGRVVGRQALTF